MKKITFSIALSVLSILSFSQKTIIVNGGKFGNNSENVSVTINDVPTNTTTLIDSIGTQSVQDILIKGDDAFVFAQDTIVKYNLTQKIRLAAVKFQGVSTKTARLSANNELIVSNQFGKSSDNIYIYNQTTLALIDSVTAVRKGVKSMVVNGNDLYVNQNSSANAPFYQDTLGYILRIDIANRSVVDSISIPNYTEDIGELLKKADGSGFYSINSVSNTITSFDFAASGSTNYNIVQTSINQNIRASNQSQISVQQDTLFLTMNSGIGAINLTNLSVIDSLIVDTIVTGFDYDTLSSRFYVTQTDFFSFTLGKIYDRAGTLIDTIAVGSSPEVIRILYNNLTDLSESNNRYNTLSLYPNPASDLIYFQLDKKDITSYQIQVFDVKGSLLKQAMLLNNSLSVRDLNKGIYFIVVSSETEVYRQKLIVE